MRLQLHVLREECYAFQGVSESVLESVGRHGHQTVVDPIE